MSPGAGTAGKSKIVDSSDEEQARKASAAPQAPAPTIAPPTSRSIATQTVGTWMDHVQACAERSSVTVLDMKPVKDQFWASVLACMKMPRGGMNGDGSMHCSFEFVASNTEVVQFLMEDLPLQPNQRYNASLPPPHWEPSPSMSTYYAMTQQLLDSYFRLRRRKAASGYRGFRGSVLAAPPDTYIRHQ